MDVKEAVKMSKHYVADLFADEKLDNLGLEEVEFDSDWDEWHITLGFSRPWDKALNPLSLITQDAKPAKREYKIIKISNRSQEVVSIKNRSA